MYRTSETGAAGGPGMRDGAHDGPRRVSLETQGAGMLLSGLILGRIRRERRRLQRQLRGSNELVAGLAHELRSPLQGLLGAAEVLARDEASDERRRVLIDVRRSALHMLHLLDDSLELIRLERQRPDTTSVCFNLEAVIADALAGSRPLRAEGVELAVAMSGMTAANFTGDPDRLRQILTNLLTNSLARTRDGHVLLSATADADGLTLRVQDSGPGIPERRQRELSGPFVQGPRPGRAGMGLAIAGRLVTALGGRLNLFSQSGEGACFHLWLPFPATAELPPRPRAGLAQVGIAEEDRLHRDEVIACLEAWGLAIHPFAEPLAVAAWIEAPTPLDALIISEAWLLGSEAGPRLLAHCRREGIALVVHGNPDGPASLAMPAGDLRVRPRPLLPGELATALNEDNGREDATPRQRGAVLVVDDHALVRSLLAATVSALGCTPLLADSGAAALRTAAFTTDIAVVLLDRNMPDIDGPETARRLRGLPATRTATMILLVNDASEVTGAADGAVDHILVRPRGAEALERRLRPFLTPASHCAERRRQVSEQDLEHSLGEDLAAVEAALARGDAASVRDGIHRMRGALRLFPTARHEAWFSAVAEAARTWQVHTEPSELRRLLASARRSLSTWP